jgi:hypothetical protein
MGWGWSSTGTTISGNTWTVDVGGTDVTFLGSSDPAPPDPDNSHWQNVAYAPSDDDVVTLIGHAGHQHPHH